MLAGVALDEWTLAGNGWLDGVLLMGERYRGGRGVGGGAVDVTAVFYCCFKSLVVVLVLACRLLEVLLRSAVAVNGRWWWWWFWLLPDPEKTQWRPPNGVGTSGPPTERVSPSQEGGGHTLSPPTPCRQRLGLRAQSQGWLGEQLTTN